MKHKLPRPKQERPKRKRGKTAALFAQPGSDFYRMPELELRGGAVLTDGCRRILVLETDKICLDMGRSIVTLYGDSLRIESYNGKRLAVCGKVTGIELSGKWEGQSNG